MQIYITYASKYASCLFFTQCSPHIISRPGSVVGVATGYGLVVPGIESWWGRNLPHLSKPALRLTQLPIQWIPGVKSGRGVTLTLHPSSAVVKKE